MKQGKTFSRPRIQLPENFEEINASWKAGGDIKKDPEAWRSLIQPGSDYPHIKTKEDQETIKENLKDPDNPI